MRRSASMTERRNQDYVVTTETGGQELTDAGREWLASWVTDTDSNVYAFTPDADAQAVAAAMARLSRNPHDLRTIIAKEFSSDESKEIDLLRRVVSQFGDDSVMQLLGGQLVFEGVSNLATKEIEWGRLAAYLEQSTRYLRFDKKDANGKYSYYTPEEFDEDTKIEYEARMDEIFDTYSDLYEKMLAYIKDNSSIPEKERDAAWRTACHAQACDAVRSLLPASTKATVGVQGSMQAVQNMIHHMMSHELPEVRTLGHGALEAIRGVAPVFFERTDMPERGGLIQNHRQTTRDESRELATELLRDYETNEHRGTRVTLISVDGSEEELVAKILADSSSYPYEEMISFVAGLSDEQKKRAIDTYAGDRYNRRAKPGRAFELLDYLFEIQCDYGAFRDIQRHRMVSAFEWQQLRPSLGHVVSQNVKDAGLEEPYERAFKLSNELYDTLQSRGYTDQAQYATLFGHIMRFTVKVNARSFTHTAELRTTPQGHPSYRKIYQDMYEQVATVHPNVAATIRFVSQAEDEELARLGAERYSAQKFGQEKPGSSN